MHVIMVEDETMVARRLARCVESVLGASLQRLEIFGDLRSAEAHLQATVPDVLLLDWNLLAAVGLACLKAAFPVCSVPSVSSPIPTPPSKQSSTASSTSFPNRSPERGWTRQLHRPWQKQGEAR